MERISEEQLKYIQGNRDRRVRRRWPVAVGQAAAEFLQSGVAAGPKWRRRLMAVLEERAGELLKYASVNGVRAGELRLHVAEPAVMYSLRVTWQQPLLELLRAELPEAGIHTIRFTAGGSI